MAVSLLDRNYQTNYCEFSYDDWNTDKDSIPTMNTAGKGILSTIRSCCQGSAGNHVYRGSQETDHWKLLFGRIQEDHWEKSLRRNVPGPLSNALGQVIRSGQRRPIR